MGFDDAKDDTFLGVLLGTIEEDKQKDFAFRGFRSPPPMDVEDTKVNPLHVIFELKGVNVGKEYFRVNHFLPPPFNLAQGPTLLGKSVVTKLALKESLKCLEQFTIYIWTYVPLAKMNAYLRKMAKKMGIEIDLQRIMGQNLCKINKHFL